MPVLPDQPQAPRPKRLLGHRRVPADDGAASFDTAAEAIRRDGIAPAAGCAPGRTAAPDGSRR